MTNPDDPQATPGTAAPAQLKRWQSAQVQRDLRSKAALKANMARRKAQASGKAQVSGTAQAEGEEIEAADQGRPEDE